MIKIGQLSLQINFFLSLSVCVCVLCKKLDNLYITCDVLIYGTNLLYSITT